MADWEYGGAYKDFPIEHGTAVFDNGSRLKVHDLFNPVPAFMANADLIFVDPPWSKGNLNTFYTKANKPPKLQPFERFYKRLFTCIKQINPDICYIEIGKEYLSDFVLEMKKRYKYVSLYNSTYYHKKENLCYVIRGSNKSKKPKLDGLDEEDIIEWVMQNEDYTCVGDLCMGRGLVAVNAFKSGHRFVGTELNHKRLSVTLSRLCKLGARYKIEDDATFGELLISARNKRDFTRAEVAKLCGITAQSYFRYETNPDAGKSMRFETACKLSRCLDMNIEEMAKMLYD